jgi:NDP-sugar pyrophosphorylase family protein
MPQPKKISKAVVPAAGLGTRMLPATKVLPKEMLPVAGKPLIQYAIEELVASGITSIILVVRNHFFNPILNEISRWSLLSRARIWRHLLQSYAA